MQCIYCLIHGLPSAFAKREHVVPVCLGKFHPISPTIAAADGLVCSVCNGQVFQGLEIIFAEDSYEGVYWQRVNPHRRLSVILRGERFKITRLAGFGDKFFEELFVFLKIQDGRVVTDFRNQIKLRRPSGGHRVFMADKLSQLKPGSKDYRRIEVDLKNLDPQNIAVFADSAGAHARCVETLRAFGVDYTHPPVQWRAFCDGDAVDLEEEYDCTIDRDIARVLAKITFNYFAYCALKSGHKEVLFHSHFDEVRAFIHAGIGHISQFVPSIEEQPVLQKERDENVAIPRHLITFLARHGKIVATVSFFGLPAVYKVILGDIPSELIREDFGSGHAFDPFTGSVVKLIQRPPTEEDQETPLSFGLFNRN